MKEWFGPQLRNFWGVTQSIIKDWGWKKTDLSLEIFEVLQKASLKTEDEKKLT